MVLLASQRTFYKETQDYLRSLGFKGVITASNWATADPRVLGPLEKYSYTPTDFIDRHGYFGGRHKGEASEWSIRDGHTYTDRSALRFDPDSPGKPRAFVHPAMDPSYDGKPSMISETTWNRPNRYRPGGLSTCCYAGLRRLAGSDSVVHFAFDGFGLVGEAGLTSMQPWTLMTLAMDGPVLALRRPGLSQRARGRGDLLVDLSLSLKDLVDHKGKPLPQGRRLRRSFGWKDVPKRDLTLPPRATVIDLLVHYAGRGRTSTSRPAADHRRLKDGHEADRPRLQARHFRRQHDGRASARLRQGRADDRRPLGAGGRGRPESGGAGRDEGPEHRVGSGPDPRRRRRPRRQAAGEFGEDPAPGDDRGEAERLQGRSLGAGGEADREHWS